MKEVILKVEGMMCGGCENRVQNSLKTIEGINEVIASHEEGTVKVTMNENVNLDEVKERIEDLGFNVEE